MGWALGWDGKPPLVSTKGENDTGYHKIIIIDYLKQLQLNKGREFTSVK